MKAKKLFCLVLIEASAGALAWCYKLAKSQKRLRTQEELVVQKFGQMEAMGTIATPVRGTLRV